MFLVQQPPNSNAASSVWSFHFFREQRWKAQDRAVEECSRKNKTVFALTLSWRSYRVSRNTYDDKHLALVCKFWKKQNAINKNQQVFRRLLWKLCKMHINSLFLTESTHAHTHTAVALTASPWFHKAALRQDGSRESSYTALRTWEGGRRKKKSYYSFKDFQMFIFLHYLSKNVLKTLKVT